MGKHMLNISFKNFVSTYLRFYYNHILYTAFVGEHCTRLSAVSNSSSCTSFR